MTMIATITTSGEKPLLPTHCASSTGICVSARKTLRTSAPSRIRKIMPVASAVPYRHSISPPQRMPPSHTAKKSAPTVPTAAASVGVKMPP